MEKRLFGGLKKCSIECVLVLAMLALGLLCGSQAQLFAQGSKQGNAVSNSARLGGDKLRTRFVADLSKKVPYRIFTLADPYRVVIDLPDVNFQMPAGLGKQGRGLVSAFRFGRFAPGKSRIVIDVTSPFVVEKSFIIAPVKDQPARLVLDLVPGDNAAFLAGQAKLRSKYRSANVGVKKRRNDEIARIAKRKKLGRGEKPVVVIDPGHGGVDSGAISRSGLAEKEVVLHFSRTLRKRLKRTGKFTVYMTRDDDTFIPLSDRVQFARQKGAGLLLSIHADSLPRKHAKGVRGATIYTLDEKASDEEARALAAKENRSDILVGVELPDKQSPVSDILIDLAMRETKNESIGFANMLLGGLKGKGKLNKKPLRSANLAVLRAPDVPSILLELGYLSSKEDEKLLNSDKWQIKVADSIVGSVKKYFSLRAVAGSN